MRTVAEIHDKDPEALAEKACEAFYHELKVLLHRHEKVVVSLCGGTSITHFYKAIHRHAGKLSAEEWARVHFFWTDERLVPPGHEDSNYRLAMSLFLEELLEKGFAREANIHRYRGEGEPEEETKYYDKELHELGGNIHLPVMGVGSDCHVGALFPGHPALDSHEKGFLHLKDSPKPPPERETLSPRHIMDSDAPFLFFIGEAKREAYEKFNQAGDFHEAPCRLALRGSGKVFVVTNL